jgi:hypothetical protein
MWNNNDLCNEWIAYWIWSCVYDESLERLKEFRNEVEIQIGKSIMILRLD